MATERKHAWGARKDNALIGKDIPRIDALPKVTGAAKYTADTNTPGTLVAKLLTCKLPHAKLVAIDTQAAMKVKGVKAVHLFKEIGDESRWDGELIAAVAAERPEQAEDGVKALEATVKYEALDSFVDESDREGAEKAGRLKKLGNASRSELNKEDVPAGVKAAFEKAAVVHKGTYGIATISHMCLEPHGAHCEFKDGNLDVHLSTQNVSGTPGQFAEGLELDMANVTVTANYEGGGFGSKFAADEWGIAAAKMAKLTGRPVKLMLDRATELKTPGTRPSAFAEISIGADKEGTITAWDSVHWGTAGVAGGGVDVTKLPYVFDFTNRTSQQYGISCNVGPNRAWRAPPHPQLCALTMTAIDDIAAKLKMDSYDVFLKNLSQVSNGKAEVYADQMKIAGEAIGWKKNYHLHGAGGKGPVKRGLGMALHTWGGGPGACKCTVKVHPDGSVETFLGSQDIGTGTRTVLAIVLAETFGIPLAGVKVNLGSSKYPASAASGGSITVGGVSGANRRAAQDALWKIFDLVQAKYKLDSTDNLAAVGGQITNSGKPVCTWKEACGLIGNMPLEVQGEGPKNDGLTSNSVGGVQMVDLSVDTETGLVRIHKMVAVQDCGLVIDTLTAKSQILGGLIMGITYALTEERVVDNKTGRYINADLENYKLARIGDVGELEAIIYQPDSEYERGVIGLGEPPVIAPGAAISNAVANAIGVRVPVIPLTPKRILEALKGAKA